MTFSSIPARLAGAALATVLLIAGCDPAPLDLAGDRVSHSIYGVLDPGQDTQWVRVEPIPEPTGEGSPSPLNVTVVLENLVTGQTWTLHDSVMTVQTEPHHNFWTSVPIKPGTSYRIEVQPDSGQTTWAETTTPTHPPQITLAKNKRPLGVLVSDIDKLAALKMRYYVPFGFMDVSYYDHVQTRKTPEGYKTYIDVSDDIDSLGIRQLDSLKIIAASGGPDWPDWEQHHNVTIHDLAVPDSFSNVHGGKGRVAGVYRATKTP